MKSTIQRIWKMNRSVKIQMNGYLGIAYEVRQTITVMIMNRFKIIYNIVHSSE